MQTLTDLNREFNKIIALLLSGKLWHGSQLFDIDGKRIFVEYRVLQPFDNHAEQQETPLPELNAETRANLLARLNGSAT